MPVAARHASSAGEDCVASAAGGEEGVTSAAAAGGKASSAESVRFADGVQLSGIAGEVQ